MRLWGSSRRALRWWLIGAGLPVSCAGFIVWAAGARDDAKFNRAVGWATILAFAVGVLGVAVVAFDKSRARAPAPINAGRSSSGGPAGRAGDQR
jgi:hypothetical protein